MGDRSKIEWTNATLNPVTGCTKISEGCANCFAERVALRMQVMNPLGKYKNGFKVTLHPEEITKPLRWTKPRKIFVNSMSDLFHPYVPFDFISHVFTMMSLCPQHIFQILTKRPERMFNFIEKNDNDFLKEAYNYNDGLLSELQKKAGWAWHTYYGEENLKDSELEYEGELPLPNVWLGTSVENAALKTRIDILRKVQAKIRFISFEPLLEDIGNLNLKGIHWVIVGGESGSKHRPLKQEWVFNILKQCKSQEVPFFFKQWGGLVAKSGGCLLQNKEYKEYPL